MREEDLAKQFPIGPSVDRIVEGVKQYADAGFTHLALVQIGDRQAEFCELYQRELGPALRAAFGTRAAPSIANTRT